MEGIKVWGFFGWTEFFGEGKVLRMEMGAEMQLFAGGRQEGKAGSAS